MTANGCSSELVTMALSSQGLLVAGGMAQMDKSSSATELSECKVKEVLQLQSPITYKSWTSS